MNEASAPGFTREGTPSRAPAFVDVARLGISKSHLCDIERGRKAVSPDRTSRFADACLYCPLPRTFRAMDSVELVCVVLIVPIVPIVGVVAVVPIITVIIGILFFLLNEVHIYDNGIFVVTIHRYSDALMI